MDSELSASSEVLPLPLPPPPMEALYASPLPLLFSFTPTSGFAALATWIRGYALAKSDTVLTIVPQIATYIDAAQKNSLVNAAPEAEKDEYQAGVPISAARWRAGGSIGLVVSKLDSITNQGNNWHTVAVARLDKRVWVHDPAYDPADYPGDSPRASIVRGNATVWRLLQLDAWNSVEEIYY